MSNMTLIKNNYLLWSSYLAVFSFAFHSTILSLYKRWIKLDEAYSHGFLIFAVVIYLIYEMRDDIRSIKLEPYYFAAIPLLVFNLAWWVAYFTDIIIVQQLLLPLILLSVVTLICGVRALKLFLFPIGFIYFAIPIWDYTVNFLQGITVHVVGVIVQLTHLTAFIEGDTIKLPSGDIVVAYGCAGVKYLIISAALSFLSSYIFIKKFSHRVLIILLGIFLGLLTNWIRVYALIVIGYLSHMESGLLKNHETFGWLLFIIVFFPLFVITNYIKDERKSG